MLSRHLQRAEPTERSSHVCYRKAQAVGGHICHLVGWCTQRWFRHTRTLKFGYPQNSSSEVAFGFLQPEGFYAFRGSLGRLYRRFYEKPRAGYSFRPLEGIFTGFCTLQSGKLLSGGIWGVAKWPRVERRRACAVGTVAESALASWFSRSLLSV